MKPPEERLPRAVYSAAQVRDLDRRAIEELGVPSFELMTRAADAALAALRARYPDARRLHVYCGAGNNAGDGYLLAAQARAANLEPIVLAAVPSERLQGDAARAARQCAAAGVPIEAFAAREAGEGEESRESGESTESGESGGGSRRRPDVVVDALLGTGLDRDVTGAFAAAIAAINGSAAPVVALDVPSGLSATTGLPMGCAVRAALTVTFVGLKQGLYLGVAEDFCGEIEFASLGLPAALGDGVAAPLERLTAADVDAALPRRARSAHKGDNGRVVLIGGAPGMAGAIRLAAEAALRVGAGLVHVATHPASAAAVAAGRPELMCRAIAAADELDALLEMADVAVVGPGLGQTEWGEALWRRALATELPLIVDADGLNWLARSPIARGNWLLTPHPGEAGRLLGSDAAAVQRDRAAAARELVRRYGGVAVLKGSRTLVAADAAAPLAVCDRGNPGMASGGMGDVLAGALGGIFGQCRDLTRTARAGVLLHALAGDTAAAEGERGMIASDLFRALRRWANPS